MTTAFQQALAPPASMEEEWVQRDYLRLRSAARAVLDAPAAATLADLDDRVRAVREASREVRFGWAKLEPASPYRRDVPSSAIELIETALERPEAERASASEDLFEELTKLETLKARARIGQRLRDTLGEGSVRGVARKTSLSSGYISQLINGVKGPPSIPVAKTIDRALGSNLAELVQTAHERITERKASADRVRAAATSLPPSASPLVRVTQALAADKALLELTDAIQGLEPGVRRSLLDLVRALRLAQ